MNNTGTSDYVRTASREHLSAIDEIYRLARIEPPVFLEIAESHPQQPAPLLSTLRQGGFISPPSDQDMELTLEQGLAFIYIHRGEVAGYNRVITGGDAVYQEFCNEFQIDKSLPTPGFNQFTDWSGNLERQPGKVLKRIHWLDREQALLALKAASAGLENKKTGKLVWAVDAAVHPQYRGMGVAKALIEQLNAELSPEFQFRVFRIFEVLKIKDIAIKFSNVRSEKTFIDSTSRQFAYTEEDVTVNDGLTLRVRWNYWLRHF